MLTMPVLLAAGEGDAKFVQIAQEMSKNRKCTFYKNKRRGSCNSCGTTAKVW